MTVRALFWGWYVIGLALLLFYHVPRALSFSNGLFLLFYAIYAVWIDRASFRTDRRLPYRLAAVLIFTYALEYCGTVTGFPFGPYVYTEVLGFAPWKVPAAISFAWVGVMMSALTLSTAQTKTGRALQAGGYAVLFDLVLDPVAAKLGFWTWGTEGVPLAFYGVPLQNFAAWFAAAALLSLLFPIKAVNRTLAEHRGRREALRLYQGMLLMFGLLAWKEGLVVPGLMSFVMIIFTEGNRTYDTGQQKQTV
ncbi:carotenoid biosynthesis protein [Paenibacillus gansuensis]|uniref:Carotenoid biosynthesis protein n=1 Tax=Paenibacillus gansuensis TaxID=306542 RepID=A0ABW5PCQ3_9BACL